MFHVESENNLIFHHLLVELFSSIFFGELAWVLASRTHYMLVARLGSKSLVSNTQDLGPSLIPEF